MRPLLATLCALLVSGCAGFHAVERGEWKLVWVDTARRDPEAPREIITRDAYEAEVDHGTRRGYEAPPGYTFPLLHETDRIGLTVGEVMGLRVDEATEAELFLDGAGLELFWGPTEKKDGWKVDTDVTVRESMLYVRAQKPGTATLRLIRGSVTRDVPVKVK